MLDRKRQSCAGWALGARGFPLGKTVLDPEEDHRVEMRWLGEPRDSVSWDKSQGFGTGTPQMGWSTSTKRIPSTLCVWGPRAASEGGHPAWFLFGQWV